MYRVKLRIRFVLRGKIASPESVVSGSLRRLWRRAGLPPGGWYAVQSTFLSGTAY
jgi:hypothetical protein